MLYLLTIKFSWRNGKLELEYWLDEPQTFLFGDTNKYKYKKSANAGQRTNGKQNDTVNLLLKISLL